MRLGKQFKIGWTAVGDETVNDLLIVTEASRRKTANYISLGNKVNLYYGYY